VRAGGGRLLFGETRPAYHKALVGVAEVRPALAEREQSRPLIRP
jgi:hypothetical protein